MNKLPVIQGSGKGAGGSVRSPVEDPNTIRSRALARFVDLLSIGPMQGFVHNGNILTDCILEDIGQPSISGGGLVFDPAKFVFDGDVVVAFKSASGSPVPIFGDSSGYPTSAQLDALIEGDGTGAVVKVVTYTALEHPTGKVKGLKVTAAGTGYTTVKVRIPPVVGLAIFFDDIPLQRPDTLAFNFRNVKLQYRLGHDDQSPMTGFEFVEEIVEGSESGGPIEYKDSLGPTGEHDSNEPAWSVVLTNKEFDRLVITLGLREGFYIQNPTNGDISAVRGNDVVRYRIDYQYSDGSGYGSHKHLFGAGIFTFEGKTMSAAQKTIEATLFKNPNASQHNWKINFYRLSVDDDDPSYSNPSTRHTKFWVEQVVGVTDVKLRYPNCALVGIEIEADQFSRIPKRSYRVRLQIVQVPSNYFPAGSIRADGTKRVLAEYNRRVNEDGSIEEVRDSEGRIVEQTWDGTFYDSWTSNPAWVFYAVCTDRNIGLGEYMTGANKWSLYKIGRYCDQGVSSGYSNGAFGFTEPRFTCNTVIQSEVDAHKFLSDLAASFRCLMYWATGTMWAVQEAPTKVSHIFTSANIVGGVVVYAGSDRKVRHTVAIVYFNDPDDGFKLKPAIYEDYAGILRYGRRVVEVTRFACSSRGEARRHAIYIVKSETNLTEAPTFKVGAIGALLRPGMVVGLHDEKRSQLRYAGRIVGLSHDAEGRSVILLDRRIPDDQLPANIPNTSYRFYCNKPAAYVPASAVASLADVEAAVRAQLTEDYTVLSFGLQADGNTSVTIAGVLPPEVVPNCVWGLKNPSVQPQLIRLLGVAEDKNVRQQYELSGIEFSNALFDAIDKDAPYSEPPITYDTSAWKVPNAPTNLRLHVNSKSEQGILVYTLTVSWSPASQGYAKEFQVWVQKGLGNYQQRTVTGNTSIDIRLEEPDNYCVRVYAVGVSGSRSSAAESCTIVGTVSGANEELISGLELEGQANDTEFLGSDASFDWRVNWSGASSELHTEIPPILPPGVQDYIVVVQDPTTGNEVYRQTVGESRFVFTLEKNLGSVGGPHRDFIFAVQARTIDGAVSLQTKIRVANVTPPVPSCTVEADDMEQILVKFTSPAPVRDFGGYRIWRSTTLGFTPDESNLAYDGPLNSVYFEALAGTTYYFRVAAYDVFSRNTMDCLLSSEYSATGFRRSADSVFNHIQ